MTLFLLRVVYYGDTQVNLHLSWVRLILYQCELSWSLTKTREDQVDTPLPVARGGKVAYPFVVSVLHGDLDEDLASWAGWVKANRQLLR